VLLQAPPPTQENGEGIPINKSRCNNEQQGNKTTMGGRGRRYLKMASNNGKQLATGKAEHQGAMVG